MTLAIALRCSNGLVMTTDSRVTGGARKSADISEKFLQINRDVGVMTYGLAIPGYRGIRSLVEEVRKNPARYSTMESITNRATRLFQDTHRQFINESQGQDGQVPPEISRLLVGYIIGGYDGNDTAQFRLFHTDSSNNFRVDEQTTGQFLAAQFHLSAFLLRLLDYPGMTINHGLKTAVICLILTSQFESTVGGPLHLATVTFEEGFTLLPEHEVASIVQEVQPILLALSKGWLDSW